MTQDIQAAFMKDFQALLDKYQVDFSIVDDNDDTWHPGQVANIFSHSQYDKNHNMIRDTVDFNLPSVVDCNPNK